MVDELNKDELKKLDDETAEIIQQSSEELQERFNREQQLENVGAMYEAAREAVQKGEAGKLSLPLEMDQNINFIDGSTKNLGLHINPNGGYGDLLVPPSTDPETDPTGKGKGGSAEPGVEPGKDKGVER